MNVTILKVLVLACVLQTQNACSDLPTTVHIQNYEGPIYLNSGSEDLHHVNHVKCPRNDECPCHAKYPVTVNECTSTCHSKSLNFEPDCTCVSKNRNNMVPINTSSQSSVLYGHKLYGNGQYPLWCFPYNLNRNQGYGKSRYPDMFSNVVATRAEGQGNGNVKKCHRCGCSQV